MKMENLKFMVGRGTLVAKKYSPEILMGLGVVGVVTSTVLACKATLKVEEVLDNAAERMGDVEDVFEEAEDRRNDRNGPHEPNEAIESYTESDYKKDKILVRIQTGAEFAKLYAPAAIFGIAGIGCFLSAHGIMRKRNLALVAAYKVVDNNFRKYRQRVIDELGADKDELFRKGLKAETKTVTKDGKKTKEQVVEKVDPNGHSEYARFYDTGCKEWTKDPNYNFTYLRCQQNLANDLLQSRGHIFLNEVYDMLGIPRTKAGAVVGWVKGQGDDFVDFGIFNGDSDKARDFVNGYERSILLDFNVSGVIYDLI